VVDRALVIACAVVWLLALGFGVAAGVALAEMGSGHTVSDSDGGGTPGLLYVVIGVSALVIALAIPLLLRARNSTSGEPASSAGTPTPRRAVVRTGADRDPPGYPGPTPARYSASVISTATLDRMWLRCGFGVLTATGAAFTVIAIGTHLMAADSTGAGWACYGVAGLITVAMVAIPVLQLRELRTALAAAD
jgi:hypothetical protein